MQVFYSVKDSWEDIDYLCIAVTKTGENQRHVGIYFKLDDDDTKLLHLPWHKKPLLGTPLEKYIWYDVAIDQYSKIHMAALCEIIGETNAEKVPYGVFSGGTTFTKDGKLIQKDTNEGLTCSTFVLEVFSSQGFRLVDKSSWPENDEDKDWARKIMVNVGQYMMRFNILENDFLVYQFRKISEGLARIRPEHVAAAASQDSFPSDYDTINAGAQTVLDDLITYS